MTEGCRCPLITVQYCHPQAVFFYRKKQTYIVAVDFLSHRNYRNLCKIVIWTLKKILLIMLRIRLEATTPEKHVYVALARLGFILQFGGGGVDK